MVNRMYGLALPDGYDGPIEAITIANDGLLAIKFKNVGVAVTVDFDDMPGLVTPVICGALFIRAEERGQ